MIKIRITEAQVTRLRRPLGSGLRGGFQVLIERLQQGIRRPGGEWVLEMRAEDARRVIHYSTDYGKGTYQSILQEIAPQAVQELAAIPPPAPTPSLFEEDAAPVAVLGGGRNA